jgi:hypothetical protein
MFFLEKCKEWKGEGRGLPNGGIVCYKVFF